MKLLAVIFTLALIVSGCSIRDAQEPTSLPIPAKPTPSQESPSPSDPSDTNPTNNEGSIVVRYLGYQGKIMEVFSFTESFQHNELIMGDMIIDKLGSFAEGSLIEITLDRATITPLIKTMAPANEVSFKAEFLGLIDSNSAEFKVGDQIISLQYSESLRGNFPDFPPKTVLHLTVRQGDNPIANLYLYEYKEE